MNNFCSLLMRYNSNINYLKLIDFFINNYQVMEKREKVPICEALSV